MKQKNVHKRRNSFLIRIASILCCSLLLFIYNVSLGQLIFTSGSGVINIAAGGVLGASKVTNPGGTINNNGTINSSGDFNNGGTSQGNGTYNIGGNFINTNTFTPGSSTVNMNGSGAQSINNVSTTSFYNLSTSGVGTKTPAAGTLTVGGNLTVTTGNLALNTNNNPANVTGNVTNNDSITVGSGAISVGGSWSNSGLFTCGTGTVTFNSTSTGKTIAGTLTGTSKFNILTFNGSGGAWSFSNSADVAGNFTITNGSVTAPSGNLNIGSNLSNSGTFTDASGIVTFNGSSNSTVTGSGTFSVYAMGLNMGSKTTALDVQSNNFITGINSAAGYNFNLTRGTFKYDNTATLNDCHNYGLSSSLTIPFNVIIESDKGKLKLGSYTGNDSCVLSGKLFMNGGTVFIQEGQAYNSGYDCVYKVNGGTPQLYVSSGFLRIGGGFHANNTGSDYVDFNMSGGQLTVADTGESKSYSFELANNTGGITTMSGGTLLIQDACNASLPDVDFGGANVSPYSVTGGTIQLGNQNTQSGSTYFGFQPNGAHNYPNIDFEAGTYKYMALWAAGNISAISIYVNPNMQFDASTFSNTNISIIGTNGTFAFDNAGTFNCGTSNLIFSGTSIQAINCPAATTVYNLTMNNTSNATLSGNMTLLNTFSSTQGRLNATTYSPTMIYSGASLQTIKDSCYLNNQLYNLTDNNSSGVNQNTNFTVTNNLVINSGTLYNVVAGKDLTVSGTITNSAGNAGFVLQSNASGTASLIHNTNNVPGTMQRYISGPTQAWHFLSSPVSNQLINGTWTPAGTYGNGTGYDLYVWNEPTSCWIYKLDTVSTVNWNTIHPDKNFDVERGYLYSVQDSTHPTKTFIGNLNNGSTTYSITDASGIDTLQGYNLVGNPYPSSIDWQAASGWTRSNLVNSSGGYDMWIWNPTANNYGAFNSNTGIGTNSVTRYIAPMQSIFVRAASAGSLGMNNSIRVNNGSSNWFKDMDVDINNVSVVVSSDAGLGFDEVKLCFGSLENAKGANKLFSRSVSAPSLYMPEQSNNFTMFNFTNTEENPVVPVNFIPGLYGNYTITCNFDFSKFDIVMLEDHQTNYIQNMKANNSYSFTAESTDAANRFVLYFGPDKNHIDNELPGRIFTDGSHLVIDLSLVADETEASVYDVTGRVLLKQNLSGGIQHNLFFDAAPQVLIVTLQNPYGKLTKKIYFNNNF